MLWRRFFQRLTADHETALCSSACFPSGEVSPQRLAIFLANTRTSALRLGACGPRHPYGPGAQPEKHPSYVISLVPDCERLKQLLAAPDRAIKIQAPKSPPSDSLLKAAQANKMNRTATNAA